MQKVVNAFFWKSFEFSEGPLIWIKNYLDYKHLTWIVLQLVFTPQKGKVDQALRTTPTSN